MKAAVLSQLGTNPIYADFDAPTPAEGQTVIRVKAAAIKQLDRSKAAGKHYTSYPSLPVVVGVDGVGMLDNGRRIYALGITGMMAEQALVAEGRWTPLPDGLSDALAAALPNALLGADAALVHRAKLQAGETVLINGATGTTGSIAVQAAKARGAGRIIATGRNEQVLENLRAMGVDEAIVLTSDDAAITKQFQSAYERGQIDVVVDYLWGRPMEALLNAMTAVRVSQTMRIVTVGEMAGATIVLPSGILRSRKIELLGSGIGSLTAEEIGAYMQRDMPLMLEMAAAGKLTLPVEEVPLKDVESAWERSAEAGKRIVLVM